MPTSSPRMMASCERVPPKPGISWMFSLNALDSMTASL